MTAQFTVGTTYYTRSICDHNTIHSVHVLARTAKTIVAEVNRSGKSKVLRIAVDERGNETVKPLGSYSMAPMVDATDTKRLYADWEKPAADAYRIKPPVAAARATEYTLVTICTDGRQLTGHGYSSWEQVERAVADRLRGPTQVRAFAYVCSDAEGYVVTTLDNSQLVDIRAKYGVR
jgi:hypothetical protein